MKKTKLLKSIFIFSAITFGFLSCASKPESEDSKNNIVKIEEEAIIQEDSEDINEPYIEELDFGDDEEYFSNEELALDFNDEIEDVIVDETENPTDDEVEDVLDDEIEDISEEVEDVIEDEEITAVDNEDETETVPEDKVEDVIEDATETENTEVEKIEIAIKNENEDTKSKENQNAGKAETPANNNTAQKPEPSIGIVVKTNDDEIEDVEDIENETEDEEIEVEIIPSRKVSLPLGAYLEIEYPGRGWVYMGATDGTKNLTSEGRKINDKNTTFNLLARKEGTSILHFFKEDSLAGVYIDDYIEVIVEEVKTPSSTRIKAPSYAETVPAKPKTAAEKATEKKTVTEQKVETPKTETPKVTEPVQTQTTTQTPTPKVETPKQTAPISQTATPKVESPKTETTVPVQKTETPKTETPKVEAPVKEPEPEPSADDLLKSAKTKFAAKNYQSASNDLELFLTVADKNRDEALFLLGQIYEANSPVRDIKKSIEYYEKLMDNYPVSNYWDDANKRVIYLKRFYINIR